MKSRRSMHVCYTDEATAKNGERTGFQQMWADVAKHRFDLLLFWSLDRLTREGTHPAGWRG